MKGRKRNEDGNEGMKEEGSSMKKYATKCVYAKEEGFNFFPLLAMRTVLVFVLKRIDFLSK